jgi:hypothetical protein
MVTRWRADLLQTDVLVDDVGAAAQGPSTSANSASYTGFAMGSPQGVAYDASGNLYVLPSSLTAAACSVSADESTVTALNSGTALTHTSATLAGNPVAINTNGYTASGSLPQLLYADFSAVNICD